jgi:Tfp pilus assembly protein PilN
LPRRQYSFETFEIPSPEKKFVDSIVEFELDKHISSDLKNFYFSYHTSPREGKMMRVTSAALKKETTNYYLELLYRLKLSPSILDVSTCANANLVLSGKLNHSKPVAIADLGPNDLEITIIKNRDIEFSRQISLDDPEIGDVYFSPDEDEERLQSLTNSLSSRIINQIQEGLSLSRDIEESEELQQIYLLNGGSFAPLLSRALETDTGAVASQPKMPGEVSRKVPENFSLSLMATSLGLAVRALKSNVLETNLLPESLLSKEEKKKTSLAVTLPVLAILVLVAYQTVQMVLSDMRLAELGKQLEEVKDQAKIFSKVDLEYEEIQSKLGVLQQIEREHPTKLPVLRELTDTLPKDTWLTNIKIKKNQMEIRGYSASASGLIHLLEKSPYFKEAGFVGAVIREKALEKFTIKVELLQNP